MKDHARVGLFHLIEGIDTGSTARRELEDRWLLKPWRSSSLIAAAALSPHPSTFEPPSIYVPTPSLLCVAGRRATRPNGEWGYSTRRHMLGHECPETVSPERGVVLTDLQSSI